VRSGRKLVAVLYADMVGYSRLIGVDDAGTLQRLRNLRANLIDPAIEGHGGRIVQTGGDSLLVVFDSVMGRCAAPWRSRSGFRLTTATSRLIVPSGSGSGST
jgi:class 3 adenylate cyclase